MNIQNCNTLILFSTPLTSSVCATRSRNSVSSSTDIFTCAVVAYLKTTDINYSITTKINSSVIDSFVNSRLRIILYENHSWKTSEGLEILTSSSFYPLSPNIFNKFKIITMFFPSKNYFQRTEKFPCLLATRKEFPVIK